MRMKSSVIVAKKPRWGPIEHSAKEGRAKGPEGSVRVARETLGSRFRELLPKGLGGSDRRSRSSACGYAEFVSICGFCPMLARFVYRAGFYTLALLQGSFRAGAAAGCLQGELHGEPVALAAGCSVATAAPDVAALRWRFWRQ